MLTADCDRPSVSAARRKLRPSATATNICKSLWLTAWPGPIERPPSRLFRYQDQSIRQYRFSSITPDASFPARGSGVVVVAYPVQRAEAETMTATVIKPKP